MNYKIKEQDGVYALIDAEGEFVDAFASRSEAVAEMRERNTPATETHVHVYAARERGPELVEAATANDTDTDTAKAPVTITIAAASDARLTKAQQVRNCIAQVKAQGGGLADVAQWAVENLGMARQLAMTYTKNNWDRV